MDDDRDDSLEGSNPELRTDTPDHRLRAQEANSRALMRIVKRILDTPESESIPQERLTEMRDALKWLLLMYRDRDTIASQRDTVKHLVETRATRDERREKIAYMFISAVASFIVTALAGYFTLHWK